jgi:hypothetical protein
MPQIHRLRLVLICLTIPLLVSGRVGADEPAQSEEDEARRERLAFITRTFHEFELFTQDNPDKQLARTGQPILRYGNPVRNFFSDHAVYLWLQGDRPIAVGAISIRGKGTLWREFCSLSDEPLRCVYNGRDIWTPQSGGLIGQSFTDAPTPATSPALRLAQMRQLARRFSVIMQESDNQPDEVTMLRLMSQPLYRWSDEQAGVVDGALFSFSETTDPEALVMLELVRPPGQTNPVWQFSCQRMTSRPVVFRLDDREIWFQKGYWANPRSLNDSYAEKIFGDYEPKM